MCCSCMMGNFIVIKCCVQMQQHCIVNVHLNDSSIQIILYCCRKNQFCVLVLCWCLNLSWTLVNMTKQSCVGLPTNQHHSVTTFYNWYILFKEVFYPIRSFLNPTCAGMAISFGRAPPRSLLRDPYPELPPRLSSRKWTRWPFLLDVELEMLVAPNTRNPVPLSDQIPLSVDVRWDDMESVSSADEVESVSKYLSYNGWCYQDLAELLLICFIREAMTTCSNTSHQKMTRAKGTTTAPGKYMYQVQMKSCSWFSSHAQETKNWPRWQYPPPHHLSGG